MLVDPYQDRYFKDGKVIGVNYSGPVGNQTRTETDLGLGFPGVDFTDRNKFGVLTPPGSTEQGKMEILTPPGSTEKGKFGVITPRPPLRGEFDPIIGSTIKREFDPIIGSTIKREFDPIIGSTIKREFDPITPRAFSSYDGNFEEALENLFLRRYLEERLS